MANATLVTYVSGVAYTKNDLCLLHDNHLHFNSFLVQMCVARRPIFGQRLIDFYGPALLVARNVIVFVFHLCTPWKCDLDLYFVVWARNVHFYAWYIILYKTKKKPPPKLVTPKYLYNFIYVKQSYVKVVTFSGIESDSLSFVIDFKIMLLFKFKTFLILNFLRKYHEIQITQRFFCSTANIFAIYVLSLWRKTK